MAGLLDKIRNTDTSDAAEAPPADAAATNGTLPAEPGVVVPDDASRLCVSCAALLEEGQDWCLECGTAQPGRIGGKPGRRAVLTILAVVAVLAAGAAAAAYAALSSEPEPRTVAQAPPPAQPAVPPPPAQTTPAPADETPQIATPTDGADAGSAAGDDGGGAAPGASDDPGDATPGAGAGTGDSAGSGSTGGGSTDTEDEATEKKKVSPVIALTPDAASIFDPDARGGEEIGDPADAIDGRSKTAWVAPVGDDGKVGLGLLISLEQAKKIEKVRVQTETPGFSVELYGATLGTAPEKAPGATKYWKKLDTTRDFGLDERLSAGGTYRHVLLWFTDQPATEKVLIPEVTLLNR